MKKNVRTLYNAYEGLPCWRTCLIQKAVIWLQAEVPKYSELVILGISENVCKKLKIWIRHFLWFSNTLCYFLSTDSFLSNHANHFLQNKRWRQLLEILRLAPYLKRKYTSFNENIFILLTSRSSQCKFNAYLNEVQYFCNFDLLLANRMQKRLDPHARPSNASFCVSSPTWSI